MTAEPLELLFGGYFAEGWQDRYETWERAVDTFAGENEIHLVAATEACDDLLNRHPDGDTDIERALTDAGCTYQPPPDLTHRGWLELVVERLRKHAA